MLNDSGDKIAVSGDRVIVSGRTQSKGKGLFDVWILILDKDGNLQKETTWGFERNEWPVGLYVEKNKIIVPAITTSNEKRRPGMAFIEYDKNLNIKKTTILKSDDDKDVKIPNKVFVSEKAFVGAGYYQNYAFSKYGWIFKIKK